MISLGIVLLGIYVQQSVSQEVQCYSEFSFSTGKCGGLLGEVDKDSCCLNPKYGYIEADGKCSYCGVAAWTEWSSWGECSVSCSEGVMQRRRSCHGIGDCQDSEELGSVQTKPCGEKNAAQRKVAGQSGGKWQPCSVTCDKGLKKRQRTCTNPIPQCGGSCSGKQEETDTCDNENICPTHGGWSSWGGWGPCPVTCIVEGHNTQKELRKRTCTSPAPSTVPRGRDCEGSDTDTRPCSGLPFCPIDGNWGPWSGFTSCSVTCGVGRQKQRRLCDSPQPKHGGRQCRGEEEKTGLCPTELEDRVPCPKHGMWTEWSPWFPCKPSSRACTTREGNRRRERDCDGREHGGNPCDGEIFQSGGCYLIDDCKMEAVLSEWSQWSFCKPNCGPDSAQTRERKCVPNVSKYSSKDLRMFSGQPKLNCKDLKTETERRPCKNVPQCKAKDD